MLDSRFIIGVDLGTTTTSLFYIDTEVPDPKIKEFKIPQLIAPGEVNALKLLPSFCYLPHKDEFKEGALKLPWEEDSNQFSGLFARRHGASVPSRLISSAKSWLAHSGVDRTKPILPWGSDLGPQSKSPVQVSAIYLAHLKKAWNFRFKKVKDASGSPCLFENQQVIVTIPASFDETARDLTIQAAEIARLKSINLVEEPLAAFYAWLYKNEKDWKNKINPGENVLVIDVGGGTSDFSIIQMGKDHVLQRFAVGEHLLLGGDNIDMAIARKIEKNWNTKLDSNSWSELCQLCRDAKETLLSGDKEKVNITLMMSGSSIMSNLKRAEFSRLELMEILEDGFYPGLDLNAQTPLRRMGIRQMGLPYAENPAITAHLLQFLNYAGRISKLEILNRSDGSQNEESNIREHFYSTSQGSKELEQGEINLSPPFGQPSFSQKKETEDSLCYPHKILFNGGSMISAFVRNRVLSTLASWFPGQPKPEELEGEDLSLAVAVGAAYYGRVRRGKGVKVKGGISHSYYLEVKDNQETQKMICILPRDLEENINVTIPRKFILRTNEEVLFNLYSSATRLLDQPGDVIGNLKELSLVAPLITVLQFGKTSKKSIEVKISSEETEVGLLKIQLISETSDHKWPLHFDLRPLVNTDTKITKNKDQATIIVDQNKIDLAEEYVKNAFISDPNKLTSLLNGLEEKIGLKRSLWSLNILRNLASLLLDLADERHQSPRHEMRWFNLLGYCLRPGFGTPGDDLRIREVWKSWFSGLSHPKDLQVNAEWWIMWRRIGSGLKSGHQTSIANILKKQLIPKGVYRPKLREGEQAKLEMWRCLGSLESIPISLKVSITDVLVGRLENLEPYELWTLGRLGSRILFHAPENFIIPPKIVEKWVPKLVSKVPSGKKRGMSLFAVSRIASETGDRNLDLSPKSHSDSMEFLKQNLASPDLLQSMSKHSQVSVSEMESILADTLPLGLSLVE